MHVIFRHVTKNLTFAACRDATSHMLCNHAFAMSFLNILTLCMHRCIFFLLLVTS